MNSEQQDVRVREVELGRLKVDFPSSYLQPLIESDMMEGREQLLDRLHQQGYLFLRGFHLAKDVEEARLAVLDHIRQSGSDKLDSGQPWEEGVLDKRCGRGCIPDMEGQNSITGHAAIKRVIEGNRPKAFFKRLFGEDAKTLDYKWLRGVHRVAYTGVHVDWVYMGRGTDRLLTMWTPLGDVPVEMGTLAICEGSHSLESFNSLQQTYGQCDIEAVGLKGTGWFTRDPHEITEQFGGQWKTADFQAGDVLIFTMRTVHMSTANLKDKVRISCDTRWQPQSAPVDARFMGKREVEKKFGLHARGETKSDTVTMDELKEQWGLTYKRDATL